MAALPPWCEILVRRAVRRNSVRQPQLDHPVPVDPCGPDDVIVVGGGMVKGSGVVHTNARVIPGKIFREGYSGRSLSRIQHRQPVHRVLPYRRGRRGAGDCGGGGGDVGRQPGGHEPRPAEVRVVLGRRLRARREYLRRRRTALAAPAAKQFHSVTLSSVL